MCVDRPYAVPSNAYSRASCPSSLKEARKIDTIQVLALDTKPQELPHFRFQHPHHLFVLPANLFCTTPTEFGKVKGEHVATSGESSFDHGGLLMNDVVGWRDRSESFLVLEAIIREFDGIEKLGAVVFDALRLSMSANQRVALSLAQEEKRRRPRGRSRSGPMMVFVSGLRIGE